MKHMFKAREREQKMVTNKEVLLVYKEIASLNSGLNPKYIQ